MGKKIPGYFVKISYNGHLSGASGGGDGRPFNRLSPNNQQSEKERETRWMLKKDKEKIEKK